MTADLSSKESLDLLNSIEPTSIDEAFVFFNSGDIAGQVFKVSKADDPENLRTLVSVLFNSDITYSETKSEYDSKAYDFYVVYTDIETSTIITVFAFDNKTIKYNGLFCEASNTLEFANVYTIAQEYKDAD